jgi:alpha-L-fucosidase
VYAWPFVHLHLEGLAGKVSYAQFLHDGSEIKFTESEERLILELPVHQPEVVVPVIELTLTEE